MNTTTDRRTLLRAVLFALPVTALLPRLLYAQDKKNAPDTSAGPFTLPPLPYKFDALEPFIDKKTMELHHDKHHATYVKNLNDAVAKYPDLQAKSPEMLLMELDKVPESVRTAVRNNAGGHVNHSLFWNLMKPKGGGAPIGELASAINATFGSLENLQIAFNDAGAKRFGSGWVWLVKDKDAKLKIISTPNQDSPLLAEYGGLVPVIGNDVWEHAYYLKYQNRRP
ncbi:MAG: superoxide dismutase, partial [Armatimonadetes bacterium]|nr:superoxide dismutase [Armatimonadota bacterium]